MTTAVPLGAQSPAFAAVPPGPITPAQAIEREQLMHRIVKQVQSETGRSQALFSLSSEFTLVEHIVAQLAEHWHEIPQDFADSMINICVALLCGGRRDRRKVEPAVRRKERRMRY